MDYPGKVITKNQVTPTQTSATGVWTLDDAAAATRNNNWPVAGVPNPISKSLRFNSADSAYLNRTPASASNRKTWTWSAWVKRSGIGTTDTLFAARTGSGGTYLTMVFSSVDDFRMESNSETAYPLYKTNALFRDPSAWYHIVVALDMTQATSTNRLKVYVNNVLQTTASFNVPAQNTDLAVNSTETHLIGQQASASYNDGYMTEVNFIDGQALTPSSFGMTDPVTGVWEPLKYSGTYGTNGFYLNFKDATSTTTLGLDYSGNSNTWTTNNFSVTAGAGNDSLTDVPTPWVAYNTTGDVGGVVRGNYATWNPLVKFSFSPSYAGTYSNGNLDIATGGNPTQFAGTMGLFDGCYWEVTAVSIDVNRSYIGLVATQSNLFSNSSAVAYTGTYAVLYSTDGTVYVNTTSGSTSYGSFATWTNNDVISVAFKDGKIYFAKNGTWINSGVPASGTGFVASGWNAYGTLLPYAGYNSNYTGNFGQRPFAYTPPSGFLSLCTTNLPASTILKGSDYFNAILYTGNGSASRSITGVGFQPDWVWAKARSAAYYNGLFDVLRSGYALYSNTTDAEDTTEQLTFGSDGFTTPNKSGDFINTNSATYVAWNWKANGAGVTNTAGSITSSVSANTTSGFSVVTYTGTGANATVGHGLGVAPQMVIVKQRNGIATYWCVYHTSLASGYAVYLNATFAAGSDPGTFNSTAPTSSVFSIGTSTATNTNTNTYVAYCFAPIAGYSAFGSYTGNGSADGPFVYLGFRPRYILAKRTDSTGNWLIYDTTRDTFNGMDDELCADLSGAETTAAGIRWDALSNGIKMRNSGAGLNASGGTYIYMAFAENPFKNALAR
jgi:hypothetical protein